jgi:hypothetical protein
MPKRKYSLPTSIEAMSGDSFDTQRKSYQAISHAELIEHYSSKAGGKQAQRDRYDEQNHTSGYQSEAFGDEFGSR